MSAQPCGIYISLADLKTTVRNTPNISQKTIKETIHFIERTWGAQETLDVMLMAEGLWMLSQELRSDPAGWDAIMERIKDPNLVPTIGRGNDTKN